MKVFLIIWLGQVISVIGSGLTNFGIGVWIFQKTGHATTFAFSILAALLPGILLSPIAGVLADRWNRRTAMLVSNVGAGTSSLILVLLAVSGRVQLWELYGLMALSASFGTLMWPALMAATSLLVPKEQFGRANGLLQGADAISILVAPILGAALYTAFGLKALVALDVLSFLIAILSLAFISIPHPEPAEKHGESGQGLLREALSGFKFIGQRKGLLGMLIFFLLINLVGGVLNVLFVPLMLTFFSTSILARVESAMGIGALLGTIVYSVWGGPKRKIHGVLGLGIVTGVCLCLLGGPPNWLFYAAAGALFMFWIPMINASSQAIWQSKVDAGIQGRVFAARRMLAWCSTPIGIGLAGPLADRFFTPGMMPGGSLASLFGFMGTGPGAGMRLFFALMGILTALFGVGAYAFRSVRNVERDLPDVVGVEDEGKGKEPAGMPLEAAGFAQ